VKTLLDAFALLAVLRDEPATDEVLELIDGGAGISSLNAAEVLDKLRRTGSSEAQVEADLRGLGAEVVHPPEPVILEAGLLRGRHYHHRRCPVSLADCVAAAHSVQLAVPLATADPYLITVARAEEREVRPLPDSTGKRPE
jgi:PIN domain nuclease of toxin-antitoxin system